MTTPDQSMPSINPADRSDLTWREGDIPVSTRYDDPYFSLAGGLEEARHVFLAGNDLPARLRPDLHIAELGFGTGLNLLALAQMADVPLRFTSFEGYPLTRAELTRAHGAFPQLAGLAAQVQSAWPAKTFTVGKVQVRIVTGDVRQTLRDWQEQADAWFLDGFSPAKNPDMWGG